MKARIIPKWMLLTAAALAWLVVGLVGCDDENGGVTDAESIGPLRVTTIIVNPKSPAPGDTIQLTAVIESDSANVGQFPTVSWSSSGGTFLETSQTSVRWVAPNMSTLVSVSVRAQNSINSSTRSATIFVGGSNEILDSEAGQVFLTGSSPDNFLYFHSADAGQGFEVYRYNNGVVSDAANGGPGENLRISASLTAAAYQLDEPPAQNLVEPINVYYNNLTDGSMRKITTDKADLLSRRRHQYFNPAVSNDGNLVSYQGLRTSPLATGLDSMDIFVYYPQTMQTVAVTQTHGVVRKNHIPTFSTDDNWLLFVADRSSANSPARWEYYALPINAGVVDTVTASTVQVTNSNSQIVAVTPAGVTPPLQLWNPVMPVLALVMTNGSLMQITMDGSGASTVTTPLQSRPRGFAWSDDGTMLAYTDGNRLFTVPVGQTGTTLVHTAAGESDQVADIVWAPDKSALIYRIVRGTIAWFELKPANDPATEAVVLTPAVSSGELSTYRRQMSLSPLWLDGDELLMIQFKGLETPAIDLLDISAARQ